MEIHKTNLNKLNNLILNTKKNIPATIKDENTRSSLAISSVILQEYYSVDTEKALDSLTDSGGDCKIDAFYYDDTVDISKLILVQSKYKSELSEKSSFDQTEVEAIISNVIKIATGQALDDPNSKLKDKLENYRQLLKDNGNPSVQVILFLATNGIIHNFEHLTILNIAKQNNININFIDAKNFGFTDKKEKGLLKINKKNIPQNEEKTDIIFNNSGLVCSTSLANFMEFYNTTGKDSLFSQNMRYKIKNSSINKEIAKTFKEKPEIFCFLNNGIYIVCTNFNISPTCDNHNNLELTNPSIVNGAQTTGTIAEFLNMSELDESFKKANILIRVFKETDQLKAIQVAKATNSQNKIDMVDLEANNEEQLVIKNDFSVKGIGLIVKDGEDTINYDHTISNEELLQIYAALFLNDPGLAKNSKAKVFKKYFKTVFTKESLTKGISKDLYRCFEIRLFLYKIKQTKNTKDSISKMELAWYSIMYTMKKFEPRILDYTIPCDITSKKMFLGAYKKTEILLDKIIEREHKNEGENFSISNLFKGQSIKNFIDTLFEQEKIIYYET